uniref:GIY-YIG domain-containing protein n=1 Tax=Angiostrongylus cantonensis TaxID=6313 RepID=A0A0K0DBR4_ANGCA
MSSGTVYLIFCKVSGDEYVGETGGPFGVRIEEHLVGKSKLKPNTPPGAHRMQEHNGEDFEVGVTTLTHESKTSARKTLEAFWINSKYPKMNRKEECLVITRDLAPYLRLNQ